MNEADSPRREVHEGRVGARARVGEENIDELRHVGDVAVQEAVEHRGLVAAERHHGAVRSRRGELRPLAHLDISDAETVVRIQTSAQRGDERLRRQALELELRLRLPDELRGRTGARPTAVGGRPVPIGNSQLRGFAASGVVSMPCCEAINPRASS